MEQNEADEIRQRYYNSLSLYERVSEHILHECLQYKKRKPTAVRAIFSREPTVKSLHGILKKISDKRARENAKYAYDDLPDIIAITVLCAYGSDVLDFIAWLKRAFLVDPSTGDPLRSDPQGHRGFHFIVTVDDATLQRNSDWRNIKCEIQVKTVLEEAFDAKSHDLTYKQGVRKVDPRLVMQFGVLSSSLRALDAQSEFLKDMIQEEEKKILLHREACGRAFLQKKGTLETAQELSINIEKDTDVSSITQKLKLAAGESPSAKVCRLAALCALKLQNDYLADEALVLADKHVSVSNRDLLSQAIALRSCIKWVFARYEEAIRDAKESMDLAEKEQKPTWVTISKSNLIYFVADGYNMGKQINQKWIDESSKLVRDMDPIATDPRMEDSIGFYWITFGASAAEVEMGRNIIKKAQERRTDSTYEYFIRYHEYIALKKLIRFLQESEGATKFSG